MWFLAQMSKIEDRMIRQKSGKYVSKTKTQIVVNNNKNFWCHLS